jgi:hypothetical protein
MYIIQVEPICDLFWICSPKLVHANYKSPGHKHCLLIESLQISQNVSSKGAILILKSRRKVTTTLQNPQRNSQAVKIKMSQSIRDQGAHLGLQIAPQINNTSLKLLEKHFWHVW